MLPFDVTLSGANEYGAMCAAKIFGLEILNEGMGISIDDAVTEMQATFVARVVEPMSAVASPLILHTRSFRPAGPKNPRAPAPGRSPVHDQAQNCLSCQLFHSRCPMRPMQGKPSDKFSVLATRTLRTRTNQSRSAAYRLILYRLSG